MATAALDHESGRLGRDLAELLRRLRANRTPAFSIGPQEAIDSHRLVVALVGLTPGPVELHDFADTLGPILARSPDERSAFERIIRDLGTDPPPPPPPTPPPPPPPPPPPGDRVGKSWDWLVKHPRRLIGGAILLFVLLAAIIVTVTGLFSPGEQSQPPAPPIENPATPDLPITSPTLESSPVLPPTSDDRGSERAEYAASLHGGAPTLREVARALAPTTDPRLSPQDYLRRLQTLTGLPTDRPIAMFGEAVIQLDAASADSRIDPAHRVKWAVGEVEHPGTAPTLGEVEMQMPGPRAADHDLWDIRRRELEKLPPDTSVLTAARAAREAAGDGELNSVSDEMLARAIAIAQPDWNPRDAPWLPEPPPESLVAAWSPWVAALAAALLAALLALPLLDPRRAFLRRRPPRVRPNRARLIGNMPQVALGGPATYREIRKSLQRREPRPTRMLDIRATVRATLSAGGIAIVPRFASTKAAPDYLVLIDRRNVSDLEAERAAALIAPLRTGAIGVDLYYFHSDPSRLYSETGGSAVAIEELVARYPHHRLILMGSGEEMLDLYSGRVTGGYARLTHWRRRGLLTPVPRSEWAREETLIAREFNGPVARSTSGGMLALARNLLAETGRHPTLFPDGDEGAAPLPRRLVRLLREAPGEVESADPAFVEELLSELIYYPDGPGFEWLCAMAVYPAATFDLAMYLGRRLPEWPGAPEGWTLYTPARLAALTRLPWLREGRIPTWLRRALIARLSPERSAQVRGAILALVASAEESQVEAGNRASFAKEPAKGPAPQRLFEDEVMVEFLRGGKAEDLEVDLPGPKPPLKSLRERIDLYFTAAAALILACATTAWYAAPGPEDGPAAPILWVPLALLALIGLGIAAAVRPASAAFAARRFAIGFGPSGLVLAGLAALALVHRLFAGEPGPTAAFEFRWWQVPLAVLALGLWPYAAQTSAKLRNEPWADPKTTPERVRYIAWSFGSALIAGFIVYLAWVYRADAAYYLAGLMALGIALFVAGVRTRPPGRIPPQPDLARLRTLSPRWAAATFAPAFLLLLLPIWAAAELRGDRDVVAPADGYERLVATSADGSFIATAGGPDGRTITVVAADSPGNTLWQGTVQSSGPAEGAPGSAPSDTGRIVSLAVARQPRETNAFYVAAATLDGTIYLFDRQNRQFPLSFIGKNSVPITPRHLAIGSNGMLAYDLHLSDGSTGIAVEGRLVSPGGGSVRIDRAEQTRVTALSILESYVVWTGANGEVMAGEFVPGNKAGEIDLRRLQEADGPHDRMLAGARLIRPLASDGPGRLRFIAVADDGSAVIGTIDVSKNSLWTKRVDSIPQLALGPVIPWTERGSVTPSDSERQRPPSPQAPGAQQPAGAGQTPVGGAAGGPPDTATPLGKLENYVSSGNGRRSIAQLVQQIGATASDAVSIEKTIYAEGAAAGLNNNQRLAALLAVMATETAGFRFREERVRNDVDRESDAYRYRGRGFLMLTGRANYDRIGKMIGVDLIANPDLLLRADISTRATLAYWRTIGANRYADTGDMNAVYRRYSGSPRLGAQAQSYYGLILRGLGGAEAQATAN